jgi:hypothetical protein
MRFGSEGNPHQVELAQSTFFLAEKKSKISFENLQPLPYTITKDRQLILGTDRKTQCTFQQVISPWLLFYRLLVLFGWNGNEEKCFRLRHQNKRGKLLFREREGVMDVFISPFPQKKHSRWFQDAEKLLSLLIGDEIRQPYANTVAGLCS